MKISSKLVALSLAAVIGLSGCAAVATTASDTGTATDTTETGTDSGTTTTTTEGAGPAGGGPGNAVDASSVTTEAELIALIQSAYGDGGLGLHRGHEPVQDVLDAVLGITHEELHVRLDAGQNLAAVAEDLGIDPQTLIDAMVESWGVAIDDLLAAGTITEEQAEAYYEALEEAFTFRVTWNGTDATPTFNGLDS